jgi:DNA repair photolyase
MRKGDAATYQEVRCRSALNRVKGMPFEWTLNPYRGCTHGCHYCFARRYHTQFELDADDSFASVILVKVNFVDVLSKELSRDRWDRETSVALGTATDPYQPIEGQYKLTRGAIVELGASRTPFGIVTKGPMVMRDADVLQQATRTARVTVCVSVPTVDEDAWRKLEPGTAHPRQRFHRFAAAWHVAAQFFEKLARSSKIALHMIPVVSLGHQGLGRSRSDAPGIFHG